MYLSLVYSLNKVNSQDKFPTAFTLQMCVCACVRACVRACILLLLGGSAPGCPDDPRVVMLHSATGGNRKDVYTYAYIQRYVYTHAVVVFHSATGG